MTSFKTRVIGAVILVSLAIIFVPMLFKSPGEQPGRVETPVSDNAMRTGALDRTPVTDANPANTRRLEVPPAPEVPEFTIEEPEEPALRYTDRAAELDAERAAVEARGSDDFQVEQPAISATQPAQPAGSATASGSSAAEPAATTDSAARAPAPTGKVSQPTSQAPTQTTAQPSAPKAAEQPAAPKPAPVEQTAPAGGFGEAWAIQIGSFADQARAQKLRADLQKEGTAAYVQEVQLDNGSTMVRVYAGPMLERNTAEKLKVTLDRKFEVNSLIMRYRPVQP